MKKIQIILVNNAILVVKLAQMQAKIVVIVVEVICINTKTLAIIFVQSLYMVIPKL